MRRRSGWPAAGVGPSPGRDETGRPAWGGATPWPVPLPAPRCPSRPPHPVRTRHTAAGRTRLPPSDRPSASRLPVAGRSFRSPSGSGAPPRAARRQPRAAEGAAQMVRQVYELRVRGPVPVELLEEIGAEDFGEEPPLTILRTEPTDQPGLHGMLQRLRSLGLDLLEVRTTGPESFDEVPEEIPDEVPDEVP